MENNGKEVSVTRMVFEGVSAVRDAGETNMFDRWSVIEIACGLGYSAAAQWVREHPEEYLKGVFCGFEVAPKTTKEKK